MNGPLDRLARAPTGRWSVWKYMWIANRNIVRALERARPHAHGVLLDMGCGARPFEPVFAGHVTRYLGTDLAASQYLGGRRPDAYARAEAQPLRTGAVDTVLGLSMLTYLPEPGRMLDEAWRVLRPGGTLILEFTQSAPLHDEPHDYFRFTRYGAAWLLDRAGFEPVEVIPVAGAWVRTGMWWIQALNRLNRGPLRILTELPVRLLYVAIQATCAALDRAFFDPREAIAHIVVARRRP